MIIKQLKKSERRPRKILKILTRVVIPVLMINFLLIAGINGAELNKVKLNRPTLDSLTLIYNHVDASSFPKIVSLVSVMNAQGFVVGKLDENNFEVHEDAVRELPIEVIELTNDSIGIDVVLIIDRSGSMTGQPMDDEINAAKTFVDLMQEKDQSAIVSFSSSPRTDCSFTNNKEMLKTAISALRAEGQTAIFDALVHTADLIKANLSSLKNRAIIVMTDGDDDGFRYTYQDALNALLPLEVIVFAIGLELKPDGIGEQMLKDLAKQTGGRYYPSATSENLEEIYKAISKILHHRYQVSYSTHNSAKDGTLRHVQIDVFKNTSTSWDTASYRAPFEAGPVDTLDPVDPEPEEPPFEVLPNPFTPNDDGFNDWVEFKKGDEFPMDWNIAIMDRSGRLIRNLNKGETVWDGKDKSGKVMLPGFYLYTVFDGNRAIHRGLIQLIR